MHTYKVLVSAIAGARELLVQYISLCAKDFLWNSHEIIHSLSSVRMNSLLLFLFYYILLLHVAESGKNNANSFAK